MGANFFDGVIIDEEDGVPSEVTYAVKSFIGALSSPGFNSFGTWDIDAGVVPNVPLRIRIHGKQEVAPGLVATFSPVPEFPSIDLAGAIPTECGCGECSWTAATWAAAILDDLAVTMMYYNQFLRGEAESHENVAVAQGDAAVLTKAVLQFNEGKRIEAWAGERDSFLEGWNSVRSPGEGEPDE